MAQEIKVILFFKHSAILWTKMSLIFSADVVLYTFYLIDITRMQKKLIHSIFMVSHRNVVGMMVTDCINHMLCGQRKCIMTYAKHTLVMFVFCYPPHNIFALNTGKYRPECFLHLFC